MTQPARWPSRMNTPGEQRTRDHQHDQKAVPEGEVLLVFREADLAEEKVGEGGFQGEGRRGAEREGIPHQTLAATLLHKYVSTQFVSR